MNNKFVIPLMAILIIASCKTKRESLKKSINESVQIQLIRNATVKLTVNNKTILIDPILADKSSQNPIPFSNDIKIPMIDLPMSKDRVMENVDAVLITHYHPDHFDTVAEEFIPKTTLVFCQPSDSASLAKKGFSNLRPFNGINAWNGLAIERHLASHHIGATGAPPFGESSSYSITYNKERIFITGDAILDKKLLYGLEKVNPTIVLANTGECQFSKENPILSIGEKMTLSKEELVQIKERYPSTELIAVHLNTINHCSLTREQLTIFLKSLGMVDKIKVPKEGEIISLKLLR